MSRPGGPDELDVPSRQRRGQLQYFEDMDHRYMLPVDSNYVRRQVEQLMAFAQLPAGARVLEIGCGMGRYTFPLVERGLEVEGLDLSQSMLDELQRHNPGQPITTHCASVDSHPPELDGAFDAVVGFFVLHHLDDLGSQLVEIRRMLRPGGLIAFLEPNPYNPLYYAQITFSRTMAWWGERGMFGMRRRRVFELLGASGFASPRWDSFGFFPPFLINRPWGPRAEDALQALPVWRPFLPFLLIRAEYQPLSNLAAQEPSANAVTALSDQRVP